MHVPRLRFKDDDGQDFPAWEESTIGEKINEKSSKFNPEKSTEAFKCIELEHISQNTGELLGYISTETSKSIKNRFQEGDVLFGKLRPYLRKFLKAPFDGVCSTEIWVLKGRGVINEFLFQFVQTESFVTQANISSGSKMPRADWGVVSSAKSFFPSPPEQTKIANFLTAVDEKVQLLTQKSDLLAQYKKGVMQKIFSQELRFKDDDGHEFPEWERMKVSNFLIERNIQTPKSEKYPLMAFIANKGVSDKGERYDREFLVNNEDSKKYKQTEYGDFIYSSNNLETGSIGLNNYGSATISPVYSVFQITELCNRQFIGCLFSRKEFINKMIRWRQGVVYGQWRIHESNFLKIEEKIPCLSEQTKIANFLSAIDDKITQTQAELAAVKQYKQGLLQQMFV